MLHVNALLDRHDAVAALVSDNFVDLMAGASEELDGMIQVPSVRQLYFDSREQGWVWGVRRVVRRGWEREREKREKREIVRDAEEEATLGVHVCDNGDGDLDGGEREI